jgi:hypothetical protein
MLEDSEREPLSSNLLYCSLEDKLLEHGEETDCPDSCAFYYPCRALWKHISENADDITIKEFQQYQLTFEYFFENIVSANHTILPDKNPFAVRLGRIGGKARANSTTYEERSKWGRIGARKRWHPSFWDKL